jgi:hypothetical protein
MSAGPSGGDSPLTSPEAVLAAAEAAVAAAVAASDAEQQRAGMFLEGPREE